MEEGKLPLNKTRQPCLHADHFTSLSVASCFLWENAAAEEIKAWLSFLSRKKKPNTHTHIWGGEEAKNKSLIINLHKPFLKLHSYSALWFLRPLKNKGLKFEGEDLVHMWGKCVFVNDRAVMIIFKMYKSKFCFKS